MSKKTNEPILVTRPLLAVVLTSKTTSPMDEFLPNLDKLLD